MSTLRKADNYTKRIVQGDTFYRSWRAAEVDEGTGVKTSLDISGETITGSAKNPSTGDTVTFTVNKFASVEGGGTIDSFSAFLDPAVTATMAVGPWDWDIQSTNTANNSIVKTILRGKLIVKEQVTI
jgi:hypothetical protein